DRNVTGVQTCALPILPAMASADVLWGQCWSEPGAGSDLASVRSTATRTEGGWLLNGQKTWCTRGAFCDWGFGLFRTDPNVRKHRSEERRGGKGGRAAA